MKKHDDDITSKTITHLSLCSGYEGIGLGLRRVLPNVREIAYVEREGFPIANLVAKMEEGKLDAAPVFTDVKTFPYRKFRGLVDILSGGFPCQPFSSAGKRKGVEDPRHLFPYIRDGIAECRPRLVFLENVEGIISSKTADGESVLQYVLGELEGLGYRATAGIFSASEVGAPHQRKRVFILGMEDPSSTRAWDSTGETERGTRRFKGLQQGDRATSAVWTNPTSAERLVKSSTDCWPSRPKETQQEWEEPRVVDDTESRKLRLDGNDCGKVEGEVHAPVGSTEPRGQTEGQVKPKLGRTTNGSSSRVDRLRLLGNGVVPATAAKAFLTLINRL